MRPRRIGAHCSAASTRDPFDSHNRRALALALALALDLNLNPPTRAAAPVTSLTAAALAPLTIAFAVVRDLSITWSVGLDRAIKAGRVLADVIASSDVYGTRPVTLVATSLGARMVFECLLELARRGFVERVADVVLLGCPVGASARAWRRARSAVAGRFVNAFNPEDSVLKLLYRVGGWSKLTLRGLEGDWAWSVGSVAGLRPVHVVGVENVDISKVIKSHSALGEGVRIAHVLRSIGFGFSVYATFESRLGELPQAAELRAELSAAMTNEFVFKLIKQDMVAFMARAAERAAEGEEEAKRQSEGEGPGEGPGEGQGDSSAAHGAAERAPRTPRAPGTQADATAPAPVRTRSAADASASAGDVAANGARDAKSDAALASWAQSSEWASDTGGETDASGAPIRAQAGRWHALWSEATAEHAALAAQRAHDTAEGAPPREEADDASYDSEGFAFFDAASADGEEEDDGSEQGGGGDAAGAAQGAAQGGAQGGAEGGAEARSGALRSSKQFALAGGKARRVRLEWHARRGCWVVPAMKNDPANVKREGFICPMCKAQLASQAALLAHFEELHEEVPVGSGADVYDKEDSADVDGASLDEDDGEGGKELDARTRGVFAILADERDERVAVECARAAARGAASAAADSALQCTRCVDVVAQRLAAASDAAVRAATSATDAAACAAQEAAARLLDEISM